MANINKNSGKPHQLGLFGFLMITSSMVISIYIYPTFATSGFAAIFFLLFAGLLWFIPVCLVAAELGTGGQGWANAGVFSWGAAALGKRWGFMMIYLQFMEISIGFVAMLYFITGALAYVLAKPEISQPGWLEFFIITGIFWIITCASFWGTKMTKYFATYGFIFGVVIPVIVLITLGVIFVAQGNTMQIQPTMHNLLPNLRNISSLVVLASFILSYMGPEASAVHVNYLKNPGRNYPIAIFILVGLTLVFGSLASTTIAITVPVQNISLSAGILEAFSYLFKFYNMTWLLYPFGILIAISAVGEIASWVNGPIRGMLFAAQEGIMHPKLAKMNKYHMPVNLMIVQALLVTVWIAVLTFGSTGAGNAAFFTAITLTVITYLTMYVLLFISYVVLKVKTPDKVNPRRFSMKAWIGWPVAIIGLIATMFAFCLSFVRPSQISISHYAAYLAILIIAYVIILAIPNVIYNYGQKHEAKWRQHIDNMKAKGHTFHVTSPVFEEKEPK